MHLNNVISIIVVIKRQHMRLMKFCGAFLVLMMSVGLVYAQPGEPCYGTDPDAGCPLDTWVIVFAGAAFLLAALHLHRRQKHQHNTFNDQ